MSLILPLEVPKSDIYKSFKRVLSEKVPHTTITYLCGIIGAVGLCLYLSHSNTTVPNTSSRHSWQFVSRRSKSCQTAGHFLYWKSIALCQNICLVREQVDSEWQKTLLRLPLQLDRKIGSDSDTANRSQEHWGKRLCSFGCYSCLCLNVISEGTKTAPMCKIVKMR